MSNLISRQTVFAISFSSLLATAGCSQEMPQDPSGTGADAGGVDQDDSDAGTEEELPVETAILSETVEGYGVYVYTVGVQHFRHQLVLSDSSTLWERTCPLSLSTGVRLDDCGLWKRSDLSNLRGEGEERYGAVAAYLLETDMGLTRRRIFIEHAGVHGWGEECPVKSDGIQLEDCSDWEMMDIAGGVGPSGAERYGAYSASVIEADSQLIRRQVLVERDGEPARGRDCVLDASGGVEDSCDFETLPLGTVRYGAYGAYTFTRDGVDYRRQILADLSGEKLVGRECPTSESQNTDCAEFVPVDLDF